MKLFLPLLFFAFSFSALADFSGKFQGTGKAIFASGRTYQCDEIFLQLKQSDSLLKILFGGYICGILQASFDPVSLSIKADQLIYQGEIVGSISDERISLEVFDPEDGSTYSLKLEKTSENELSYLERWLVDEKVALEVKGSLRALNFF